MIKARTGRATGPWSRRTPYATATPRRCPGARRFKDQCRPDHLRQICPPQQREHREKHMRDTAIPTPSPPRAHRHRTRIPPQHPGPGPAPRSEQPTAIRAHQPGPDQLVLDLRSVRNYREHSAPPRYTALPDARPRDHREGLRMPSIGKAPPPTNPPAPGTYIRQRRHTVRPNPPPTSAPSKSLNNLYAFLDDQRRRHRDGALSPHLVELLGTLGPQWRPSRHG